MLCVITYKIALVRYSAQVVCAIPTTLTARQAVTAMKQTNQADIASSIAKHLKHLRNERGLSLDKVSALTGVSKAMLGQIERKESSPSIATLWKIATGLNTSFSSFISSTANSISPESDGFDDDPNMHIKTLFPFRDDKGFEMFELCLTHFHEQRSSAHQHGVTEHIHVLEGRLSVHSDGDWVALEAGEQYILNASSEHGYRDDVGRTRFIAVIHYPKT